MQALSMVVSREGSDTITKMQLYVPKITFRFVNHRLKTTIFKTIQLFKLIFSFGLNIIQPTVCPPRSIYTNWISIGKNQLENYCKTQIQEVKAASQNPSSLPSSNSEAEAAFPDLGLACCIPPVNCQLAGPGCIPPICQVWCQGKYASENSFQT